MPSSRIFSSIIIISSLSVSSVVFCRHLAEEEMSVDCCSRNSSSVFFVYMLPIDASDTYSHIALTCCNRRAFVYIPVPFFLIYLMSDE